MPTLSENIQSFKAQFLDNAPTEVVATMNAATEALLASGIENRALGAGDKLPDFELPNQHGEKKRIYSYLEQGPVVLNIYRGGWCPYCNLEMKALIDILPEIRARGAHLVGLAPETPDKAAETSSKNRANFDILSDTGNHVSGKMGLVFELSESLRPLCKQFGIDIPAHNGDETFKLPLPATYIVRKDGVIAYGFAKADYTLRMEPAEVLAQLDAL
ncbi:MAG: AhpC/TSA family protein [Alphaproteobacteria bacterium]|nr:AhpC/TSA family protein [Alphaproteobacteria bacterium]